MTLGNKIAQCRKDLGLTQEALAQKLDVTNQAVSKWETDQCCPDTMLLPRLADIFDITIDELFGRETSPKAKSAEEMSWEDDDALRILVFRGRRLLQKHPAGTVCRISIAGSAGDVYCAGDLECGDVAGDISAGGYVECGDVAGDISAGGYVECGDVGGTVNAGSYVECGDVAGDLSAGSYVECGDVGGSVKAQSGYVECGDTGIGRGSDKSDPGSSHFGFFRKKK